MGLFFFFFFAQKAPFYFLRLFFFTVFYNTSTILNIINPTTTTMLKSFVNLGYLLSFLVQPQIVNSSIEQEEKSELFHFLKVVASEELDKLDSWDSDDLSDESDIDETVIEIPARISSDMFRPILPKTKKTISKKTSRCKGITRSDKISFARWRWGKQVLAKDGSVIAIEEELDDTPVLRSTQCLEYLVIRNTGRPSTMCRKCYEINRTLQYGLRDMKRGKLGKKKIFSPDNLIEEC